MNKIHMQVEQTRQSASRMQRSAMEMSESCDSLHAARRRLAGSWHGGGSRQFDRDFRNCLRDLENQIDDLDRLVTRMQREIDQWEAEDNDGLAKAPIQFNFPSKEKWRRYGLEMGWSLITGNVIGGISTLFRIGQGWVEDNQKQIDEVIIRSDETIDDYFRDLLGGEEGSTERMRISMDGEFTIPGAEVSVPGSFILGGGKDYEIIRNPDGTYTFYLEDSTKIGLKHDFTPNARAKFGGKEYKVGTTAEVGASASPISYAAFTFDPKKKGDLTKMVALMGSIGVTLPGALGGLPAPSAGPALYLLKDNLTEFGTAVDCSVEGELSANALVKLAGVDAEEHLKPGSSMIKEDGKWKRVSEIEAGGKFNSDLFSQHKGVEEDYKIQSITDVETGETSYVITRTIKIEEGAVFDQASALKELTGGNIGAEINQVNEIQVTYRLDPTVEEAKNLINGSDEFSNDRLLEKASKEVRISQGTAKGMEAGGNVNVGVGQEIGVDGGLEVTRSSQQTIYTYP